MVSVVGHGVGMGSPLCRQGDVAVQTRIHDGIARVVESVNRPATVARHDLPADKGVAVSRRHGGGEGGIRCGDVALCRDIGATVGIVGYGVSIGTPLCVQGHVAAVLGGKVAHRHAVSVGVAAAVRRRIPTVKGIARLGETVVGQGRERAVDVGRALGLTVGLAVAVVGHGVGVGDPLRLQGHRAVQTLTRHGLTRVVGDVTLPVTVHRDDLPAVKGVAFSRRNGGGNGGIRRGGVGLGLDRRTAVGNILK